MKTHRAIMGFVSVYLISACGDVVEIDQIDPDEAKAALLQVATLQELYYLDNDVYTEDLRQLRFTTDPAISNSGLFEINLVLNDNGYAYSATARYLGANSSNQECQQLRIDSRGDKTSKPNPNCWAR